MTTLDVPIVETARLRLRGRTLDDFPFFAEMWKDENVTRFIGGVPRPREDTWSKFLRTVGHWSLLGFSYWAVEEKATGALIGEVGFGEFKREIEPRIEGAPEIGWIIVPSAHGKGYAGEAAKAAVDWGDQFFKTGRMSCIIDPGNAPSIRVAEKCGFTKTGTGVYHGSEILILHRDIAS